APILFRLDLDDIAFGFDTLRGNVMEFFEDTMQVKDNTSERLKKIIVEGISPEFDTISKQELLQSMPKLLQTDYDRELNVDQQAAFVT
ncbi:hypothetical protein RFI_26851, partial [Reticulomyxa filosa]